MVNTSGEHNSTPEGSCCSPDFLLNMLQMHVNPCCGINAICSEWEKEIEEKNIRNRKTIQDLTCKYSSERHGKEQEILEGQEKEQEVLQYRYEIKAWTREEFNRFCQQCLFIGFLFIIFLYPLEHLKLLMDFTDWVLELPAFCSVPIVAMMVCFGLYLDTLKEKK